ncbi:MAG: hypothetical protein ACYCWW_11575 [Deltaproteobacteria bacterium]
MRSLAWALVIQGVDYFGVWARLMLRRYRDLARHLVTLEGPRPSSEELVALLRERTRAIP